MTEPTELAVRLSPAPTPLWRRLAKGVLGLPLWAVPFALFFGTLNGATPRMYGVTYGISLVFGAVIGTTNLVVGHVRGWERVTAALPPRFRWLGSWAVYLAANIVASLAAAAIVDAFWIPGFLGGGRQWLTTAMFASLFTLLIGGLITTIELRREAAERTATVERVRRELVQAELRALRAQIHPHFLFNTLNTIAALIAENPRAAEEVVTRLADVFRYALRATERETAPLAEELAFVAAYLEVERARFGPRLRLAQHVDPGLDAMPVPSLVLQPLVENAVRYAVSARPEGGLVHIAARRERETLVLEVIDDGPGLEAPGAPGGHGIGLESVRERLRWLGAGGTLDLLPAPGGGTCARLRLPVTGPSA